mmetsp:Transcript_81289/g.159580  ORF Transcript_81289/g.159580 Transcript_81289/m.159580 type:complete len:116 (-) Transcript_81289:498-845(-)
MEFSPETPSLGSIFYSNVICVCVTNRCLHSCIAREHIRRVRFDAGTILRVLKLTRLIQYTHRLLGTNMHDIKGQYSLHFIRRSGGHILSGVLAALPISYPSPDSGLHNSFPARSN